MRYLKLLFLTILVSAFAPGIASATLVLHCGASEQAEYAIFNKGYIVSYNHVNGFDPAIPHRQNFMIEPGTFTDTRNFECRILPFTPIKDGKVEHREISVACPSGVYRAGFVRFRFGRGEPTENIEIHVKDLPNPPVVVPAEGCILVSF